MSDRTEKQSTQAPAREDELLGVIADVEKQLSALKIFRSEREETRQRLEKREAELTTRQQELSNLAAQLEQHRQEIEARRHEIESGEARLHAQHASIERDLKALSEEQSSTQQHRQAALAEIEHQTNLLAQREQRLTESAAALSRQREDLETQAAAISSRQKDLDRAQADSERTRAEMAQLRADCEEARALAQTREDDLAALQAQAQDLLAQVAAARGEGHELRADLTRSSEAQSSLMAELAKREEKLQAKRDKLRILADELQKRTAAAESLEEQLAGFKRQVIDRDTRVQELSQKLSAATSKLKELSQTFQEQAEIMGDAESLRNELDERRDRIEALEAELLRARADGSSGPESEARITELLGRVDSLEQALNTAHADLHEALAENRSLADQLTGAPAAHPGNEVPTDVGEAVARRWNRLRWMRTSLRDQAAKLNHAGEALRQRYEECERILAQRETLATAHAAVVDARKKLERLQAQAAKTKASALAFYAVLSFAILAGLSWLAAGQIAPATYAATAIIAADTKGAEASDDQLIEWQRTHEALIADPRVVEVAAERMARRGITTLGTPGALDAYLQGRLSTESPAPGQLTLELRGQGATRLTRILDTYIAAVSSQANAAKDRRVDGLGTTVVTVANPGAGPISDARLFYAVGIFAGGLSLCLCFFVLMWKRLAHAKVKFEEEQLVDAALAEANWRQATDALPARGH